MKKIVKVLALAAMLVMGGQAMAQTRGAMFLSGAFPLKDYADFDSFDDFALTSIDLDDDDAEIRDLPRRVIPAVVVVRIV